MYADAASVHMLIKALSANGTLNPVTGWGAMPALNIRPDSAQLLHDPLIPANQVIYAREQRSRSPPHPAAPVPRLPAIRSLHPVRRSSPGPRTVRRMPSIRNIRPHAHHFTRMQNPVLKIFSEITRRALPPCACSAAPYIAPACPCKSRIRPPRPHIRARLVFFLIFPLARASSPPFGCTRSAPAKHPGPALISHSRGPQMPSRRSCVNRSNPHP